MNKILQIIQREYITRVRKRAFIIMTVLGPILFATLLIAPYKLSQMEDKDDKTIAVVELDSNDAPVYTENFIFKEVFSPKEHLFFQPLSGMEKEDLYSLLENTDYYGILVLNHRLLSQNSTELELITRQQPSIGIEMHIKHSVENFLFDYNLKKINLSPEEIKSYKTQVQLKISRQEKDGIKAQEEKLTNVKRGVGYAAGFLIYFFIFFFGAQVMRGVIEEKTNRVIEVIITSVRPFQLMIGKISGIALVGLTQFVIWVGLTLVIYQFVGISMTPPATDVTQQMVAEGMDQVAVAESAASPEIIEIINSLDTRFYLYILLTFLFYFIFGYLLYGSLFAAIGSAVDSETDTQQFMLPVTIPLILSIIVMTSAITNPDGQLVYWFSIIPFTSPVVMMARLPFQPPVMDLVVSMSVLVITFLVMTWLAGKIYRVGILMYGKKVSYGELIKWIKYKA